MNILTIVKQLLILTTPFIKKLIESKVVPAIKRRLYEKVDVKINNLIEDLAQNVSKIATEKDELKKLAYIEGSRLGMDTLKAMGEKLIQVANQIDASLPVSEVSNERSK